MNRLMAERLERLGASYGRLQTFVDSVYKASEKGKGDIQFLEDFISHVNEVRMRANSIKIEGEAILQEAIEEKENDR